MTDLIQQYNLMGLLIGAATFLIIGLFHPLVIKGEYYFGTRIWVIFLLMGIAGCIGSVCMTDIFLSIVSGVVAFSSFWSIKEVFEQEQRVKKGWFPRNERRLAKSQKADK
ncbi:MAG: DUF4491 family protein [Muribaculaceae bacterium]|nr:DUF4491 family protein [Muribaculaceae bacterium]MDE5844578.1 DUF4491 family protein [Muribaculaceae bacterium]MDE5858192.1 DUF4491 family protein [Muribaculaceae bacterium]